MTRKLKLFTAASSFALLAFGGTAHAAGTASGTTVTNNVSVGYSVGGVAQTAVTAQNQFVVDRKINLTVAESGNATTSVVPGSTNQVTTFTVTNTSNATLDFALSPTQFAGGSAPHGGTDVFDGTNVRVFVDVNNNGVYDPATDTATFIDELAADQSKTVFIVADIPSSATNGQIAAVNLTATASEAGGSGALGATVTQSAGANGNMTVETVFADAAGTATGDVARDGKHSAADDYTVSAPLITVAKTSRVISDPLNGTTNPKMIPGAVVEYCIAVTNGPGGATATNVSVSDPVPANTTYVSNSILINTTVSSGVCSGGTAGGSFAANTVSGTLNNIPASTTTGLSFQVTVN